MNLFNIFKPKKKSLSLSDLAYLLGKQTGMPISSPEEAVEKSAWVYACVRAIATKVSSVPWQISKGDRKNEKAETIIKKPNPFFTDIQLFQIIQAWKELRGIAFVYVNYPEIEILDTDLMRMTLNPISYTYYRNGIPEKLDPEKVVFFQNFSPNAKFPPLSTLSAAMSGVELQALSEAATRGVLQNGAIVPTVMETERALTPQQVENLRKAWQERYGGTENAGHTPILPPGVTVKQIGLSPVDMGVLLFEKMTKNRISTVFGVPPTLLNDTERSDYAKSKVEERVFTRNTIIPKLTLLQREITARLLPLIGAEGYEFKFLWEQLPELKEDERLKAEASHTYISDGVKTINEVRAEMGLEPVPWGDSWWGPLNITELGSVKSSGKSINELLAKVCVGEKNKKTDLIWKNFVARTTPQENKLAKELMKFWKKQKKYVLEKLNLKKAFEFPKSWDEVLAKLLKTYLLAFMQQAGNAQATELGISFDLQRPEIQRWLAAKVMKSAVEINTTTKKDILKQLQEAEANGESVSEMAGRIENLFEQTYKNRAQTVARTEVISANNKAGMEAAKQGGMRYKVWLTAIDERTRPWHAEADGQTVPISEPFTINGEELMFPGDPNGSPENIINCRCTMTYK